MPIKKLHPGHLFFIFLVVLGISFPEQTEYMLDVAGKWFGHNFGWMVMLACAFFVIFCFYIAFSRYGRLRLGDPDEAPGFSTISWLAMLFAAGMGAGLVFYGAAEPLIHYTTPPPDPFSPPNNAAHARTAMAITYFHWGLHAWAIYAVAALSIAYFSFHRHTPMLPSIPIIQAFPVRWQHTAGTIIDTFAIVAVVFGLVASLSQGVLQVSNGIAARLPEQMDNKAIELVVLASMFVCYMLSASTGLHRGIKILSNINISIAVLLMLFILFAGPNYFIMESFVSGIGDYLSQITYLSFNMRHYSDPSSGWMEEWTIPYFLWWVAWGPFVGVFIARISRGRTLKEFILGVMLVPTLFSALWFATLGGTGLYLEMYSIPGFAEVTAIPQSTTYAVLQTLPISEITTLIMLLLTFIFLVTSADSGTYVLGMFTSHGNLNPSKRQRLFWGIMVGLAALGNILTDRGTEFSRSIVIVGSIPYLFVMLWQTYNLWRALHKEKLPPIS